MQEYPPVVLLVLFASSEHLWHCGVSSAHHYEMEKCIALKEMELYLLLGFLPHSFFLLQLPASTQVRVPLLPSYKYKGQEQLLNGNSMRPAGMKIYLLGPQHSWTQNRLKGCRKNRRSKEDGEKNNNNKNQDIAD